MYTSYINNIFQQKKALFEHNNEDLVVFGYSIYHTVLHHNLKKLKSFANFGTL